MAFGVLRTNAGTALPERLASLYRGMTDLLALHRPDAAAVERLYFQRNVTTAMVVGEARGVLLLALAQAGIPVGEYTPGEIKQAITAYGSAKKPQMQEMIRLLFGLPEIPRPDDAADALAVAVCHLAARRARAARRRIGMIASVRGIVQHVGVQEVVLEVGGIGVRIVVPQAALDPAPVVGQAMFLHTRLVVREESLSLYGFSSQEQREVFDLLLQVNGVGPRLAVTILSHLPPDGLRSAVAADQPVALTKVPGIGRKTAEKIIFHLKDRLKAPEAMASMALEADNDVVSALTALGYSLVEAQSAVQSIPAQASSDVAARVRLALQYFSRR